MEKRKFLTKTKGIALLPFLLALCVYSSAALLLACFLLLLAFCSCLLLLVSCFSLLSLLALPTPGLSNSKLKLLLFLPSGQPLFVDMHTHPSTFWLGAPSCSVLTILTVLRQMTEFLSKSGGVT
eukprot:TRINITY_DN69_c0_g1_i2.p1 TRINITY_DN69_c0_g1~~TRINITY_DN69_c0_g1_i2.p1  ORF type:complete len:124 (-),score=4.17 TRINITY_DN69_c0_g1_i2:288-659(-)